MGFLDKLKGLIGTSTEISAATKLDGPPTPVVNGKQTTLPSFVTTAKPNPNSALPITDRRLANTDISTLRDGQNSRQIIADFVRASPDLSAAVTAYVRTGITSGYTAVAKDLDGVFNSEATSALAQVITRMNVLNNYEDGFDDSLSIRSLSETWARELLMTGSMAGELVLDKARLPDKIQPVAVRQIEFYPGDGGKRLIPHQKVAGLDIKLDIPTFFMVSLDQDPYEAYSVSPIEPAIQAVLFSIEFMNDMRRVVKKAIHPRVNVTLDEEKLRETVPHDIRHDPQLVVAYFNAMIRDLETKVNNLAPEEALVYFDSIGVEIKDHGNTGLGKEYEVVQSLIDAKMATGAKVLPTVLGHSNGTSNSASAEVLIFMKYVEGTVWAKLNEMLSKVLTLAVRLLGYDVVVEFTYNAIDLRPDMELEAFRAMKQSRVLELLSLGMMSDDEACVSLTGHLMQKGAPALSGTGFRPNTSVQPAGDGYNGASNSGSTMNQNLKSDAPTGVKSRNTQSKAEVIPIVSSV